jgi:Domain of Unknown Function (DUF1080)
MKRSSILAIALAATVAALAVVPNASLASAQEAGWVTLFDGSSLDGWNKVGDSNWRLAEGAVQSDKGTGFLVSQMPYGDFQLRVEVWIDPNANSGVFIRCADAQRITPQTCYEVNVYDTRPGQEYRTGGIVDVARILNKVDAGGRWNTVEITAQGPKLQVSVNGMRTADGQHRGLARGPFALQFGVGTVKFRKVEIRPL